MEPNQSPEEAGCWPLCVAAAASAVTGEVRVPWPLTLLWRSGKAGTSGQFAPRKMLWADLPP